MGYQIHVAKIMVKHAKRPGDVYDELVQNPRRLGIAHACLGVAAAFVYWVRPGTFSPHLSAHAHKTIAPIFITLIAWAPYLIGYLVSKSVLAGRDRNATLAYIGLAVVVTVIAAAFYMNALGTPEPLPTILISLGIVLALGADTMLCAAIWRSDLPQKIS